MCVAFVSLRIFKTSSGGLSGSMGIVTDLQLDKAKKEALEDGLSEKEAEQEARNSAYHDFDFPEDYLWDNIRNDVGKLPENFSKALKILAERNSELKDVLDNVDFIQFTTNRENAEILRQLVELFSEKKLQHVSADILGDAYEWVLRYFAPTKAKEGEVYTPREVISLLIEILDPKPGESVYDPASASNGMLIISYKHVEQMKGKKEADKLQANKKKIIHQEKWSLISMPNILNRFLPLFILLYS